MSEAAKSKNFSSAEMDILMGMIELHRGVIECKRTDTVTTRAKDVVWEQVATEFNAVGLSKRSAKQIRLWWDNQKKRARSRLAQNKVSCDISNSLAATNTHRTIKKIDNNLLLK